MTSKGESTVVRVNEGQLLALQDELEKRDKARPGLGRTVEVALATLWLRLKGELVHVGDIRETMNQAIGSNVARLLRENLEAYVGDKIKVRVEVRSDGAVRVEIDGKPPATDYVPLMRSESHETLETLKS